LTSAEIWVRLPSDIISLGVFITEPGGYDEAGRMSILVAPFDARLSVRGGTKKIHKISCPYFSEGIDRRRDLIL
jgi:hypothetical protein